MSDKKEQLKDFLPEQFDYHEYSGLIDNTVSSFTTSLFNQGIINEYEEKQLRKYFSNPDFFQKELEEITEYYYTSSGEVFQLLDLARVLPSLNFHIKSFDKDSNNYSKYLKECNKSMLKVKYKSLTRDIISQTATSGTFVGIWLGDKKNTHFYVFDDLNYVFPAHRVNGDWVVAIDMRYIDSMTDIQKTIFFQNFQGILNPSDYQKYRNNPTQTNKYFYLPQERTAVIRTHNLKRNDRRGLGWATQGLFDIMHKKKLKDLEKSVANKIINQIAILTIGDESDDKYRNLELNKMLKRKIHSGVKSALEKNQQSGVSVITVPEFAKLAFPEVKYGDALDPDKFESVNNDVQASFGLSQAVLNGSGGNFASAKLNLDVFYKRIAVMLEEIESEVFNKLFNLVLPAAQEGNFYIEFDKEPPLSADKRLDTLMRLNSQQGFSLKAVIDQIQGVEFEDYVQQSIYEQDVLNLKKIIEPYKSAHTSSGSDDSEGQVGRPREETPNSDAAERTRENDGNALPESGL